MIVSKQFYSEAVKVWTEQNTFEFQNSRDLKDFISECKQTNGWNKLKTSWLSCCVAQPETSSALISRESSYS